MEKVAIFLDYANLNQASKDGNYEVDQKGLIDYLADSKEGRFLQAAFAYVPIDPRQEHARDNIIGNLWDAGYVVKTKVGTIAGQSYKCDFDVEMTLDIIKTAFDIRPDIVVLISGDSDFIPVVLDLRNKGIRVEVASFGNSVSRLLINRCSDFIDLDSMAEDNAELYEDYCDDIQSEISEENIENSQVFSDDVRSKNATASNTENDSRNNTSKNYELRKFDKSKTDIKDDNNDIDSLVNENMIDDQIL